MPTEAQEQQALFRWAQCQSGRYPEWALLYHVPNGGSRNHLEARALKRGGVKPGVPDLCLPVARGGFHGLYIELKRVEGGRVTELQSGWMDSLLAQGYRVAVCKGWENAAALILEYLDLSIRGHVA
jgi:hypothetical protein